ncbi:hypothetical protein [Agrobacterium sp. LAD9]|uniref:hypothetical protein n=1 Tax=Agrobacterium sp. LAD9 TaxID=2055153 RepID=UPI001FCE8887|nr:hypothetical protein [Agrobacterium sp. LAD9]
MVSPAEYKQLYEATRQNAKEPKNKHFRWEAEQLHDFVLFMGNTGLRPDEAKQLQHRDVTIVVDPDSRERILEIEVRGKRGIGWRKSMPGAVKPYVPAIGAACRRVLDEPYPTFDDIMDRRPDPHFERDESYGRLVPRSN